MIRQTKAQGRRRCYILTDKGRQTLAEEYRRLQAQAADFRRVWRGGSPMKETRRFYPPGQPG